MRRIPTPVLAGLSLVLGGCVSVGEPSGGTWSSYVLEAPRADAPRDAAAGTTVVRLRPVTIAAYLRDDRIAVRAAPHRLAHSDLHLWAEPLADGVGRVLAEALEHRGPVARAFVSRARDDDADLEVSVRVLACEAVAATDGTPSWTARLIARWSVHRCAPDRSLVEAATFRAAGRTVRAGDHEALAAALSAELAAVADAVADVVSTTGPPGAPDRTDPEPEGS